jgi:hypothetical protein
MLEDMTKTFMLTLALLVAPDRMPGRNGAAEMCVASELKVSAVRGVVVFMHQGEKKSGANAEVELKAPRNDEWQILFKIAADAEGRFVFPKVEPGKYLLEARSYGYESTGAYVRVSRGSRKGEEILMPLRMALEGCVYASVRKRGR